MADKKEIIKLDKRTSEGGYCILAGDGWITIVQGGKGKFSRVVALHGDELESFMADFDYTVSELASQAVKPFKRAS